MSGEARDLIAGFDICDKDYMKAWNLLTEKYNDKASMFLYVMNKFTSLESANNEDPEHLKELIKSTAIYLKSLESVGIPRDNVDAVISYYLIQKLPVNTLTFWEEKRDKKMLPSFDELKTCIETRIRISSTISDFKNTSEVPKSSNEDIQQTKVLLKKKNFKSYHSTKSNLPNTSISIKTIRKFKCAICSEERHALRVCEKFLKLSPVERKLAVQKIQYCTNCLGFNHQETKCRSSYTCYLCGERRIDLVLGSDIFSEIIMEGVRIGEEGVPIAQQTHFGWILSGKVDQTQSTIEINSFHTTSEIESLMEEFLAIESVDNVNPMTAEEQWCEEFYHKTHRRNEEGRFIVRLPFC